MITDMNRHILHILTMPVIPIVLALVSCSKEKTDDSLIPNDPETFYARIESSQDPAGTKVYADNNLKILWNEGDLISIFNKTTTNRLFKFNGATGANAGTFSPGGKAPMGTPISHIYAVYPYQESTSVSSGGLLTVVLPAEQAYAENTFGLGANTMVSASDNTELLFRNLCGYLKFSLYGKRVAVCSITLSGNNGEILSGSASVEMGVGGNPSVTMANSTGKSVTLVCDPPVYLNETADTPMDFWMAIPPTEFEKGFTISVTDQTGETFVQSTSNRISVERNHLERMATVEVPSHCYGVWFPQETVSADIGVEDAAEVTLTAYRQITSGEITVPITTTVSEEGIFSFGELHFADGEAKGSLTVSFPDAVRGKVYSCTVSVEDKRYAFPAAGKPTSVTVNACRIDWQYFLNPKTGDKAIVHWTQGFLDESVDTYLKYYEKDGVRTLRTETLPDTHQFPGGGYYTAYGFFGMSNNPGEGEWTLTWYTQEKNSLGYDFIKLYKQWVYYDTSHKADIYANDYFCTYAWLYPDNYSDYETNWLYFAKTYDSQGTSASDVSYYDGNGGFYLNVYYYYMESVGGWRADPYDIVGIAEGFDRE